MAEKDRFSYDFNNIVGGDEKKKQRDHNAHPPELAWPEVEKTRHIISQRKSCHCLRFYPASNRSQLVRVASRAACSPFRPSRERGSCNFRAWLPSQSPSGPKLRDVRLSYQW